MSRIVRKAARTETASGGAAPLAALCKPGAVGLDGPIHFYSTREHYGCFSNFAKYPITMPDTWKAGKITSSTAWPTTEHYFQAMKFVPHEEHVDAVRKAKGGMAAAAMGRNRSLPLRADWQTAKNTIMYDAVKAKFTQHAGIRGILLSTGNRVIVEHTAKDNYWGDGGDGSGKNMLGKTLMRVRDELRTDAPKPAAIDVDEE
jgi:ribA/ribD-fused uncharacterized protein